ncbi:DNA topoisomerase IV subunit B, partial [Klebsiella pneumoniae]|nr:DNA topoisomerase IV subunit B [Klebsiella pneumoniae]
TKINFLPDDEIFEKTRFKEEDIKSRLHETAYLNPQLTIIYEDKREGTQEKLTFHEPDGIIGFVRELNKNNEALTDVIYYSGEVDGIQVSVA